MNLAAPKLQTPVVAQRPRNIIVEVVMLAILLALLGWFLIWPKWNEMMGQLAVKNDVVSKKNNLDSDYQYLNNLITQLKSQQKETSLLDEVLPLDSRISKVYIIGEDDALKSGMTLVSLNVGKSSTPASTPGASGRTVQSVDVSYNLQGTIDQFVNFIGRIETTMRVMDIQNIEISPSKDGVMTIKTTVRTYYYAPLD